MSRIRQMLSVVRLRPFDTEDEAGRAAERHRRVALSWVASMGGRGANLLVTLISVPLTKTYLGDERYGLWMVISSTIALLSFVDFGMGSGLLNALAAADGRDDRTTAGRYVSSAMFTLAAIAAALLAVFFAVYPFVPWARFFKAESGLAAREAGPAVIVFVICFLASLVLSLVSRIQVAYQEGFAVGVWQAAGNVASLIAVVTAIWLKLGLPWLVAAMAGAPVIVQIINGIVLFRMRPWLRPRWRLATRAAARAVLSVGFLFLVVQISSSLAFLSDNFVAEQLFGNKAVTVYAVTMRLFMLPTMFVSVAFGPLWPAYCEAMARRDWKWVRRTFYRSLAIGAGLGAPAALLMFVFHQRLLNLWQLGDVRPSPWLAAGMACWLFLFTANYPVSMLFNGLNVVRFQAITATVMAVANIALSIGLGKAFGLPGIIWGTVISYTLFEALPRCVFLPRFLRKLSLAHDDPAPPSTPPPTVEPGGPGVLPTPMAG